MKVTLHNTDKIVTINGGLQARVWEGVTGGGVPCFAIIPRIACPIAANAAEFERELLEQPPARAELSAPISTRLVI
jgi:hypothetical protein